ISLVSLVVRPFGKTFWFTVYSLFGTTREVLKVAGSDVGAARDSVGGIAIAVLNNGLRPFLFFNEGKKRLPQ
ncbi:hypothetical protein VB735_15695, partial [Halotia wernerae UHCC 0503]|nr:hypothetical protein [Halotia wernerae UHCC 0503]